MKNTIAKGSAFDREGYVSQADWQPCKLTRPPHRGGWDGNTILLHIDRGRGSIPGMGMSFDHVKAAQIKKPSQI